MILMVKSEKPIRRLFGILARPRAGQDRAGGGAVRWLEERRTD